MTRLAVVIGGASGIGAGIVTRLRADGYEVVVADRTPGEGVETVDVTDEAGVDALFSSVVERHSRLDAVVNAAGISTFGAVVDHDAAEFRAVVDVCLTGGFLVLKHAGRRMADLGQGGSLVSLASLNARQPGAGLAAYCAAKAGLVMLTQVTALELGPRGIRVNAVSPGLVVTPLTAPAMDVPGVREDYLDNTPLGRAGTVEEVAAAVAFLCSDESSWMTGETLDLNGGAHLKRYPDLPAHIERMLAP
ncbi:SDR family NAD(P)-dependent oxidoreductase [Nocardioides sp.]|uniref:SDR family NAD(P)-dependent oxidoreductase n=1 Tax=Nocardioides sp. TaxID=35761 RepID=UPI00271FB2E2|nr:SDR family oxidoreductase [Nocardioides sp.]MDO9456418.1 SDR family oxidoreductase [Nocardioides sp.]